MKSSPLIVLFLWIHLISAQHQDKVDFIQGSASITPVPQEKKITGRVTYGFNILKDVDSVFLDAQNIQFSSVLLDGAEIPFRNTGKRIVLDGKFRKGATHHMEMIYSTQPKQTVYFLGWEDDNPDNDQIWTQGQGKYTSHWLPSFDDMNEKVEFDLVFIVKEDHTVISNGKMIKKERLPKGNAYQWHFDMKNPMSSYLVAFAIGNFQKETVESASGVPIELFYEPKDSIKAEPTYRYTKHIFDFLEEEIGIPYPWQDYKQIPVQDFLYAGMENTGATIFSNTFMVDSVAFFDKNYVNVNAHELAHQWFGNLVTEQSGAHHWLHEGFATFYAYLAEKDIFGEDYYYWRLLETAEALFNFSEEGHGEALTNSSAGSLTFYEKGAWALAILQERVGEENFKMGIQNYLNKYAYANATIPEFMWEMEKASGMNLGDFETIWLQEPDFDMARATLFLKEKNSSINSYFELRKKIAENQNSMDSILRTSWANMDSDLLKKRLVLDYGKKLSEAFLEKILKKESPRVRQAVIVSLDKVPANLQADMETLLEDPSYVTMESALYHLWTDFPLHRKKYLDQTKGIQGLPNKNVRLLWLTLALITPDYNLDEKPSYFAELSNYTSSKYHFETRLLAFQFLKNIGAFNDDALRNLIAACSHHVWHFKKSSRKILQEFLKSEDNAARVDALYETLDLEEQEYLDKMMGK